MSTLYGASPIFKDKTIISQVDTINSDISAIKTKNTQQDTAISGVQSVNTTQNTNISSNTSAISTNTSNIATNTTDISGIKSVNTTQNTNISANASTISAVSTKLNKATDAYTIASTSGNINLVGTNGFQQFVDVIGSSTHILNLDAMTSIGTYSLVINQTGTGTLTAPGTVTNTTGITTYTIFVNGSTANFTSPLALASGKHEVMIEVTPTNISCMYAGKIA